MELVAITEAVGIGKAEIESSDPCHIPVPARKAAGGGLAIYKSRGLNKKET